MYVRRNSVEKAGNERAYNAVAPSRNAQNIKPKQKKLKTATFRETNCSSYVIGIAPWEITTWSILQESKAELMALSWKRSTCRLNCNRRMLRYRMYVWRLPMTITNARLSRGPAALRGLPNFSVILRIFSCSYQEIAKIYQVRWRRATTLAEQGRAEVLRLATRAPTMQSSTRSN